MSVKSFPLDIYKIELVKLNSSSNDHSSEYVVTKDHAGYKRGDRVVVDQDNSIILVDRGRYTKEVKNQSSSPQYGPNILHKEYNVALSKNYRSNLNKKSTATRPKQMASSKVTSINSSASSIKPNLKSFISQPMRKRRIRPTRSNKRKTTLNYSIPKNDLSFISLYVEAYKNREQDPKRLEAFNVALSKNPNKNVVWKGIWRGIDPTHTQKVSDAQHEMLYTIHPGTRNEMGQMNWYNIFNGNLLHATSDDLSIPRSSLDYISPQLRTKTILLTNPSYSESSTNISDNSNNVEDIIKNNLDLFRQLYEYAKLNNGAFDYSPSSFNAEKLNVKQKYGGIGDFMDTYGLSPGYLLSVLDKTFNPKYQQGGSVRKAQSKERTDTVDLYRYFFEL